MPANFPILRQCLDHAVQAAGPLLGRCLEQTLQALQEQENKSAAGNQRRELSDARRELQRLGQAWGGRYGPELKRALEARDAPAAPKALRPSSLTLVDDDQLVQSIESARLSQQLLPLVEQPLSELDGLVSAALGLPAVRPEQNPLRPEVFAKALQALMAQDAAEAASTALWTRHLGPPLGRELGLLYQELARRLKSADVRAVTYRVLPAAPGGERPARRPGDGGRGAAAGTSGPAGQGGGSGSSAANNAFARNPSAWADLSSYTLAHPMMQDFLYRGGGQSQQPLAPAYYARVDEELAGLQATPASAAAVFDARSNRVHQHLPAVDRPQRAVGIDSPLDGQVWGQWGAPRERSLEHTRLKRRAQRVGQVLGLEVVRKLVHQVAQDPQLLAPVRESIVALEPSLARLALVDPRFFSDEQHPGRRLIERVAERSFKYNDEFGQPFQDFADSVAAIFNGLNATEQLSDAQPFREALATLEDAWQQQDQHDEGQRDKVLDTVRFAEQRQAQADQIAWDLSQRTDLENVPSVVQDFLFGPWALVMANARMTDTRRQIDPGGHGGVVTDLLWSVKREVTLRHPARLFEMIPGLLERLRNGLAELGHDPAENADFFRALEKLHRPALKLRAKHRRDHLDSAAMPLLDIDADPALTPAPRQQPKPAPQFWMGRRELDAAGFEDTLPSNHAELIDLRERGAAAAAASESAQAIAAAMSRAAGATGTSVDAAAAPAPAARPQAVHVDQVMACLSEGGWVDLSSKGQWLRAELIWASSKRTLFMFVSHGGQPHTMTKRSCEKLIRERLLRPVEMHGVVQLALEALEAQAREPLAA